jgi:hypothetical protein
MGAGAARAEGYVYTHDKETDVPNGIYPIPQFHSQPSPTAGPTLSLRMRTRWRRDRLDDELASGIDPASSPELSLRAAQLLSEAGRARLANAIVEVLGKAHEPNLGRFTSAGRRQQAEVRKYADNLRALVARLRDDRSIDLQGVALTARLVNDGASPLYRQGSDSLGSAVLTARLALDRSAAADQDLSRAA